MTKSAVVVGAVQSTAVLLDAMRAIDWLPSLIITVPDDRSSMHSDHVDLEVWGNAHGVPVVKNLDAEHPSILERVRQINPDYIFVVGWSRLCGKTFRACARGGVMGYHPAPLPRLRGRAALSWTILLELEETAGSLFWIDEGTDAGALIAQEFFGLPERLRLSELLDLHMVALQKMLCAVLPKLVEGDVDGAVQDDRKATYLAVRGPADGQIDWREDAVVIDRLVRAVGRPYPGAFTYLGSKKVIMWEAEPVDRPEWVAQIGQVFAHEEGSLIVRCGNGTSIRITDYEVCQAGQRIDVPIKGQPRFRDVSS